MRSVCTVLLVLAVGSGASVAEAHPPLQGQHILDGLPKR